MFKYPTAGGRDLTKDDIIELYYMTDMENLESILSRGILSHTRIATTGHADVSNSGVQALRAKKYLERAVVGKTPLSIHEHAVLYLNPHNAMMHVLRDKEMCVLRISKKILERSGAIISNKNATVKDAGFFTPEAFRLSPASAKMLSIALSTKKEDEDKKERRKQVRQAEVLIPYAIDPRYIIGIIVKSPEHQVIALAAAIAAERDDALSVRILPSMFFIPSPDVVFMPLDRFSPIEEVDTADVTSPSSEEYSEDERERRRTSSKLFSIHRPPAAAGGAGAEAPGLHAPAAAAGGAGTEEITHAAKPA